ARPARPLHTRRVLLRKIDAFAHVLPPRYLGRLARHLGTSLPSERLRYYREGVFRFNDALTDLDARWRAMEPFGEYAQVLVLAVPPLEEVGPPMVAADLARQANDEMAELVAGHPDRFVGFAGALPLNDTDASLREIDHAVRELGALGVQMFTNMNGVPLDDPRFEPVFSRVEELDRMVWLHPTRGAAFADYATERVLFGTDMPLGPPHAVAATIADIEACGLAEGGRSAIFEGNAERLYRLK